MLSFLDRLLVIPCVVHTRIPSAEPDEHGNVVYDEDTYTTTCLPQQTSRTETQDGRSADDFYLVFFPAADVLAHTKPDPGDGIPTTLDAFSWLEVDGIGRLELEGDPAFPKSLANPGVVHHVEVNALRQTAY